MFKKLKVRLTLLNLLVAGLILLGMSAIAYVFISDNIKSQSEQVLQVVTNNFAMQQNFSLQMSPGYIIKSTNGIYPYYIIAIDEETRAMVQASFQMPPDLKPGDGPLTVKSPLDKNQIDKIVDIILSSTDASNLKSKISEADQKKNALLLVQRPNIIDLGDGLSLRYTTVYSGGYIFAIMQDMSSEKDLLKQVAFTFGVCVIGGLLLLTLGGLFLAERSIRPIKLSWQKQRDFVADASHELRTPLAAIRSNIDVVLDDPKAMVSEKQLYCEGVAAESKRMSLLVDSLLLLARADSDALLFQNARFNLADTAGSAVTFMQPAAANKNISLKLDVYALPVISGDEDRIKQVLLQLIDNALKYTPKNGIVTVRIYCAYDRAVAQVCDSGIGIAPEHLNKIFDRFYRVDPSREAEVGGHGLGLAIAKFIIERHGGSITAASEPGEGSVFTVLLPLDRY